jgi:hypothetical protein
MAGFTVRIQGLRECQRAFKAAEGDLDKEMRAELRKLGEIVVSAADAKGSRYNQIGPYKPVVTQSAVLVRQSKGTVTGKRGDFGSLQMRTVLVPALEEKHDEIVSGFDDVVDHVVAAAGL